MAIWYQTSEAIHPVSPHRAGLGIIAHMGWSVAILGFLAAAVLLLTDNLRRCRNLLQRNVHRPADGAFDMSRFIKTRTGFVPILAPVTEPAVGYGIAGGVVFFPQEGKRDIAGPAACRGGAHDTPPAFRRSRLRYGKTGAGESSEATGGPGRRTGSGISAGWGTHPCSSRFTAPRRRHPTSPATSRSGRAFPPGYRPRGSPEATSSPDCGTPSSHREITFKPRSTIPASRPEWAGIRRSRADPYLEYDSTDNFFTAGPGHPRKGVPGHLRRDLRRGLRLPGSCTPRPSVLARAADRRRGLRADGQFVAGDARSTPSPSSSCGASRRCGTREPTC